MCTHQDKKGQYTYYIKDASDTHIGGDFHAICKLCGAEISQVIDDD